MQKVSSSRTGGRQKLPAWLGWMMEGRCPLCDRPTNQGVCRDCERQIRACQFNNPTFWHEDRLRGFAWGRYDGALKQAIATIKYHDHPELARPLGHWLGKAWEHSHRELPNAMVMPIPMFAEKQKQRGFNQAELLAEAFCQITRLPLERRGIVRVRSTEAQFGLSATERTQNLKDAIQLHPTFSKRAAIHKRPRPVILLDDIYTTGATVQAATQALQREGIPVWGVVVLAKTGADRAQPEAEGGDSPASQPLGKA